MNIPRHSLRKLGYFVATADAGTVTAAAQQLNITQSALSDALTSLEREMGFTLLQRRKARGVSVTVEGNKVLRLTRQILDQFEEFEFELENIESKVQGEINIGCYTSLAPMLIPSLIAATKQHYPDITLNFVEAEQDQLQHMLNDSEIVAAFAYNIDIHTAMKFQKLAESRPYILISPKHRLAQESEINLRDIVDDNLIVIDLRPSMVNTEHFFHREGLQPKIWQKTKSIELARSLVGLNLGYTLLLHRAIGRTTSSEGMPILLKEITNPPPSTEVGLIYKQQKVIPRKLEIIQNMTNDIFSEAQTQQL